MRIADSVKSFQNSEGDCWYCIQQKRCFCGTFWLEVGKGRLLFFFLMNGWLLRFCHGAYPTRVICIFKTQLIRLISQALHSIFRAAVHIIVFCFVLTLSFRDKTLSQMNIDINGWLSNPSLNSATHVKSLRFSSSFKLRNPIFLC
jgi:hypothetical protein